MSNSDVRGKNSPDLLRSSGLQCGDIARRAAVGNRREGNSAMTSVSPNPDPD
jgi:hypothetical protein